ncbi:MAG: hypothetical protein ACODAU_03850 [Myxococcota bacterium]
MKHALPASDTAHGAPSDTLVGEGRIVEFHRLDASRRILAIVLLCPLPVVAGLFMVARPMQGSFDPAAAWIFGSIALALVVAGPLSMILSLKHIFQADDYLLVRTDGLLEHVGPSPALHRWDDVERVLHDRADGAIVLRCRDGREVRLTHRYAGIDAATLARRLEDVRRKAVFGLL